MTKPNKKVLIAGGLGSLALLKASAMAAAMTTENIEFRDTPLVTENPVDRMHGDFPDRLSCDPKDVFYRGTNVQRRIGVKFNGEVRPNDVQAYCVSEGWIDVQVRVKDERTNRWGWTIQRHQGEVELFERHSFTENKSELTDGDKTKLAAAEAKRARKAQRAGA